MQFASAALPKGTHKVRNYQHHESHAAAGFFPIGLSVACLLDRMADAELQQGHVDRAEQLSHRAAAIREAAR
jgi:predicted NodU family carbamoyl transferase